MIAADDTTLQTEILPNLKLADPFMIGSSHWTANKQCFAALAAVHPVAVTLKTTSDAHGGDGRSYIGQRIRDDLVGSHGATFGAFTDGPKTLELLDAPSTLVLTNHAKELLPTTKLGLSILQGDDYSALACQLRLSDYEYVELNMKYTFRGLNPNAVARTLDDFCDDLTRFFEVFNSLPILVKLSREFIRLAQFADITAALDTIRRQGGAIIVANSERLGVPPSRAHSCTERSGGVVVGEHLFLETYDSIKHFHLGTTVSAPPIVASGGAVDVGAVVDLIVAGSRAVQLCSVFDLHSGFHVLPLLRRQLAELVKPFGSVDRLREELSASGVEWKNTAAQAREFSTAPIRRILGVLEDTNHVDRVLAATIRLECGEFGSEVTGDRPEATPSSGTRFVVTRGNVSAWLLGQETIEENGFHAIECINSAEFCRKLKDSEFDWDLGLLPRSAIDFLLRQRPELLGPRIPREIGTVARSVYELVGVEGRDLSSIACLYHFGGGSSRKALGQLLRKCRPRTTEIIGKQVLPLLAFWNVDAAILAKPPLSRLYALFCTPSLRDQWGTLWSCEEPLQLVASERFLENDHNQQAARAVLRQLITHRQTVANEAERWGRRLRMEGFVRDCIRLLEGSF